MKIDKCAEFIVNKLNENGYEAYIVGGCIRDIILGRVPKDWNICTEATPLIVHSIFEGLGLPIIDTGIGRGTVSIIMAPCDIDIIQQSNRLFPISELEANIYEISTFRKSRFNKKNREKFSNKIEDDLLCRDFTINAIAYNPNEGIIDICGGIQDINDKIIRCIKEPRKRLSEDWIRVFRAIRFQAQLGFDMEENTKYWVNMLSNNASETSAERIQAELNIIVQAPYCEKTLIENQYAIGNVIPEIKPAIGFYQNNPHHKYDVYTHSVKALNFLINQEVIDYKIGLATLFHDIAKPLVYTIDDNGVYHFEGHPELGAKITEKILRRLNYPTDVIKEVTDIVRYHELRIKTKSGLKRVLNIVGSKTLKRILLLRQSDILAQSTYKIEEKIENIRQCNLWYDELIKDNKPFRVTDLNISGSDLIRLGYTPGPRFGRMLNEILNLVISGDILNTHDRLVDYIIDHYDPNEI